MEPSLRLEVASRISEAILRSQGAHIEARIKSLIRVRQWSEQKARETKKSIPPKLTLGLDPEDWELGNETLNGHSDGDAMVS
jgi:hypothetical protein